MITHSSRFFTLSMSLLIAFAQCGVGISSLYCMCTGTKQVEWLVVEKDDCCAEENVPASEETDCCAHQAEDNTGSLHRHEHIVSREI